MKIAITGGGAAGFFSAITAKENYPEASVTIFEKSSKVLHKVRISGGGRCNITNGCESLEQLCSAYPRGGRQLKKIFPLFDNKDTVSWFESRGVQLVLQEDGCIFPRTQDSGSVTSCLTREARRLGVDVITDAGVKSVTKDGELLELAFVNPERTPLQFDKVIVTTGGSPRKSGLIWLEQLGHKIEEPVPSLFTFNMPGEPIRKLMGIVIEEAVVTLQGTKITTTGPLLITHWGMSGPAILKLSSHGARIMSESGYEFKIRVNWVNETNSNRVAESLEKIIAEHPSKMMSTIRPYNIPSRLWEFLLEKCELPSDKKWKEVGSKGKNRLVNLLTNDEYSIKGKTTFREEFVTCGGVSLDDVNIRTMESKRVPGLYFAGEVLDIDAITGGYNLQNAWTTGFVAGLLK